MYLKSLELHGFKSFPNRTVLNFERGATVVVGPNGSGKSNISDAMRWVLGEISSRNIRGTKMEDVIFGGTDDRRPMGFAEVSVTFDNTDKSHRIDSPYEEITVTRRYYRSGESEYLINRKPVRLRDIHELFMNTGVGREGYSIIGQGKVAEMISKKSEDRRNIFEEAAGISKYRHRKEETERRLGETENNMVRVRDILGELEVRVGPLEKEAEKAKKYLELYETKKNADVALWLYDTERLRSDLKKAESDFKLAEHEYELIQESLSSLEAQSDRVFEQSQKNKLISEQLLSKINEYTSQLHKLDNDYTVSENESKHNSDMIEQCKRRISEIDASESAIKNDGVNSVAKIEGLKEQLETLKGERLELLAKQQELSEKIKKAECELALRLNEINEIEASAINLRVRIDVIKNTQTTDSSKEKTLLDQIAQYESDREKLLDDAKKCEANTKSFKEKIAEIEKTIAQSSILLEEALAKKNELLEKNGEYTIEKGSLEQRADALRRMEEHFEGYNESVRFVMREYANNKISGAGKIHGPVSQIVSTDSKYITAIETSLGASMQNIVVDDENTAKACIRALKDAKAGRATFYPITAIKAGGEPEEVRSASKYTGYIGRADRLTNCEKQYQSIVEWLLGRTVVFDNIDNASAAAIALKYRVKIVTLDGQVINAGGSYTGGSVKNSSGILSRSLEIEKIEAKAKEIDEKIKKIQLEISSQNSEIEKIQSKLKDSEQQKELLLSLSRAQFAALDSANAKLDANKEIIDKIKADYDKLTSDGKAFEDELVSLSDQLSVFESKIKEISEAREELEIVKNSHIDEKDAVWQSANDMFIRITEIGKDIEAAENMKESAEERLRELSLDRENQNKYIEAYKEQELVLSKNREDNRVAFKEVEKSLASAQEQRTSIEQDIFEYDKRSAELRALTKEKSSHKELCFKSFTSSEARLKQLQAEQDRLAIKLWEDYEISYDDALKMDVPEVNAQNRSEFASVQNSCRSKIRALGPVNVSAIEEYKDVKKRYDELKLQVDDLTRSYDELTGIVSKLEEEMKNSFISTFAEINKNFGTVFAELFGGGTAELSLSDPENVLTSGIEIKAAPPGKIINNMSLLSGGEQAFVAIALFFAILKVNPTPFCILDEIEAALDEVNVFRFGEYIKKFCADTQFVLITHRRGTMEVADRLYGVTMPERGVSKVIPLDVNEIESKKKELTDDGVF